MFKIVFKCELMIVEDSQDDEENAVGPVQVQKPKHNFPAKSKDDPNSGSSGTRFGPNRSPCEQDDEADESYFLHSFLNECNNLATWINGMKTIISADELAKDVAGAKALLERHHKHKDEINARFNLTTDAGQPKFK